MGEAFPFYQLSGSISCHPIIGSKASQEPPPAARNSGSALARFLVRLCGRGRVREDVESDG